MYILPRVLRRHFRFPYRRARELPRMHRGDFHETHCVAALRPSLLSTASAPAEDPLAVAYGNTVTQTMADGTKTVIYVNADKTWEQHRSDGTVLKGTYRGRTTATSASRSPIRRLRSPTKPPIATRSRAITRSATPGPSRAERPEHHHGDHCRTIAPTFSRPRQPARRDRIRSSDRCAGPS